LRRFA